MLEMGSEMDTNLLPEPAGDKSSASFMTSCVLSRRDKNKDGCRLERAPQAMSWRLEIPGETFSTGKQLSH